MAQIECHCSHAGKWPVKGDMRAAGALCSVRLQMRGKAGRTCNRCEAGDTRLKS